MSCNVSKFDFCILQQETFTSPTFEFENTDVSNDTFVYTVFKSFGSVEKEFPVNFIDDNTVYIEDIKMPFGNYQHELLWIRNGIKEVVFQGSLKVTNKGSNCGCTSNKNIIKVVNEDVVVKVNYSERIIERITDKGPQGDSAYQVAVENGFVGTEAEWLESLKGKKGDKGDPFTYNDFTPEQIEDLKRPAVEAAESVLIVENQISINEQDRVQAENERETAENLRVEAEILRQTNTQTAITNAENATENANTAAQNADDARVAIQSDLALKANHGYGEGEEPKTLKEVETEISSSRFVPLGGVAFANDSTAAISSFNKMFVKNDFTIIKRFASHTRAYSSPFISLENDNGDKILINNIGYVFTIQLFKSGIKTFEFTEATESIFGISAKITLFIEVDFSAKEVRISYSGYSRSISVPNLIDLRDVIFTKSGYGIYVYPTLGCRDWILIKGLYNFSARDFIFAEDNEISFIRNEHTSGSVDLEFQNPTSITFQGKRKNYVNGAVTFDRVSDDLSLTPGMIFNFGYPVIFNETQYESYSIDVNAGYISISCGTVSYAYLFRLINKITGEITYARPYRDSSFRFLIPVGSYRFDALYNCFSGGTVYRLFIAELSADVNFTIYDDVKIENSSIIRMAIPEMASFNGFYDPIQNSVIPSRVSLLRTY